MKYSIYNTYIRLSEKTGVIYNSLLDKAVFSSVDDLSLIHSDKKSELDSRIVSIAYVDDYQDEYKQYVDEMLAIENQTTSYHMIINPTLECIFNCWYCYEQHANGRINIAVLENIKKYISNLSESYESLTISFFGGEPLMCFKSSLMPIVKYAYGIFTAKEKVFTFNMTSNGYLFTESRILEMKKYGFKGAQITVDGDKKNHDKTRFLSGGGPSYDRIIDNIKMLANNECYVTIRLNCTHKNVDTYYSLSESLGNLNERARKYISIDCHIVWQESNKNDIQLKLHSLVSHLSQHRLKANKMDFRQFCYADKRSQCVVNYNGDVYKCTAIDFNNTPRDGFLSENGEIIWENNSLELRMQSKLKNSKCWTCRVLPLCHGGCSSKSLKLSDGYCLYPTEEQKDQLVINRLEHIVTIKNYE